MAFTQEESRLKRRIMVGTTLLTAFAVLGIAIVILAPRGEAPPEAKKKPKRLLTPAEEQVVAGEIYRATAPAAAPATDETKLARAMDDSVVRSLVQNLKEAAASENRNLQTSMIVAIARSPRSAKPILETELASAENEAVRGALKEALARCR